MALKLGAQKIYTFYSQPADQVVLALNELVASQERLELFTPNSKGIFALAATLSKQLQDTANPNLLTKIDRNLIGMISIDLIKSFIANPSDQEILVSLSSELFLIAAASDNLSSALKEIKPYDDEEIVLILDGKLSYYDDILFVYTLRQIMTGALSTANVSLLLNSLPTAPKEEDYENLEFYWTEVLISGLILQLAWAYFGELSAIDRKFLLQNYFYHSLVVGVPVKDRLLMAYQSLDVPARDKEFDALVRLMDYNNEMIPTTVEAVFGIKVSETVHQILPLVYEEKIKTFAQEKFIGEFYQGESNTEAMQVWLREFLRLVVGLHQHTL